MKNDMLLISGDASGDLVVSEITYSNTHHRIDRVDFLFRKKAHRGQIVKIDLYNHEDVIVTIGVDGAIK